MRAEERWRCSQEEFWQRVGYADSEELWRAERKGRNESDWEGLVKTRVRGLVLGESAEEEVESAELSHEVSRNVGDAEAGVSGKAIRII
jgi:hypothetical protein